MARKKSEEQTVCPVCGGSGQVGFFQGESRFLLTMEECPECFGTGQVVPEQAPPENRQSGDADEH